MNNKDLISQYVDTGLRIPEYQLSKLPNWAKKTYIRKRLIVDTDYDGQLEEYEFELLKMIDNRLYIRKYLSYRVSIGDFVKGGEYVLLDDETKLDYLDILYNEGFPPNEFEVILLKSQNPEKLLSVNNNKYRNGILEAFTYLLPYKAVNLLHKADNPNGILEILLLSDDKWQLDDIASEDGFWEYVFKISGKPYEIIKKVINHLVDEFNETISEKVLESLLRVSPNPEEVKLYVDKCTSEKLLQNK